MTAPTAPKSNRTLKLAVSGIIVALLLTGIGWKATTAALTAKAAGTVTAKALEWITPTFEAFPKDYRSGTVTWEKAGAYTTYTLQRSTSSSFTSPVTQTVTGTSAVVTGLTASTTYYFRVQAVGAPTAPAKGWSSTASMKTGAQAPTTQSLLARISDPHGVTIDSAGTLWVTDYDTDVVKKITPAGVMTNVGAALAGSNPRGISMVNDTTAVFIRSYESGGGNPLAGLYTLTSGGVATKRATFNKPYGAVYKPSNKKVYVSHERFLSECDYVTWACSVVMEQPSSSIAHIGITPDGNKIVMSGSNNNVLSVFDLVTKKRTVLFATPNMDVRAAVAIGDNDYLASSWGTGEIWRIKHNITTGAVDVQTIVTGAEHPRMMAYNEAQNIVNVSMTRVVVADSGIYKYLNLIR